MRKNPRQSCTSDRQQGFTMIEMLVTMTVLVAILGIVFSYIGRLQKTYKAEETKVDATQEARTFFDSLQRELHSAGFPNHNMYGTGILNATAANDSKNAVGLVSVTKWDLTFEGDVDGDGIVEDVRYTLLDSAGNIATSASTCPCTLQRTQVQKVNGTAPTSQISDATVTASGVAVLNNILNSSDTPGGTALALTGNADFGGHAKSYDTVYSGYKKAPVFQAFLDTGILATLPANATDLPKIRTIVVSVNLLANYADMQTDLRLPLSMTTTIKLNNF